MMQIWLADWHFKVKVKKTFTEYIAKDIVTPKEDFETLVNDSTYVNRALRGILKSKLENYTVKEIIFTKKIG